MDSRLNKNLYESFHFIIISTISLNSGFLSKFLKCYRPSVITPQIADGEEYLYL